MLALSKTLYRYSSTDLDGSINNGLFDCGASHFAYVCHLHMQQQPQKILARTNASQDPELIKVKRRGYLRQGILMIHWGSVEEARTLRAITRSRDSALPHIQIIFIYRIAYARHT